MSVTYTPSGSISFSVNVNASVTTGSQVLTSYNVPVAANPIQTAIYAGSTSTGSGTIGRVLQMSGSMTGTAAASTILSFTSGGTGNFDVGGSTATWNHIREIIIFNDGITSGFTPTSDGSLLTWDFSITVANVWGITTSTTLGSGPVIGTATGTTPQIQIPAGSYQRFTKPWGANGWPVDSTHYVVALGTPGVVATSLNYRIIVMGD